MTEAPIDSYVEGGIDVNGDVDAMFNLRDWMKNILKDKDCQITETGMGFGGADIWFKHEGAEYFLTIKPVMK